ncbi:MAG TPA: TetR/AcrR family transcriptional regulator [Mycobacterium sp.]|nr:TetR/AcrR family transcriptional regulator [Mycobacterium sp.]
MARTQQQRREETVGRLIDACIATIVEVGYARASAAVIAKRAGVSVGALFRHFDTMGDFMAATASEVLRRQLESFTKGVAEIPAERPALQAVLEILRDVTGGPINAVIYELTVAARTDEKLRDTLQHELAQYAAKIDDTARALPGAEGFPRETVPVVAALMRNVFDGAAVIEGVLPQPEIAAQRIPVLMALLTAALPDADS